MLYNINIKRYNTARYMYVLLNKCVVLLKVIHIHNDLEHMFIGSLEGPTILLHEYEQNLGTHVYYLTILCSAVY